MNRKANIIYIVFILLIIVAFVGFNLYESKQDEINSVQMAEMRSEYIQASKIEEEERAAKEAYYESILKDIPGIVCWGDDMTYGRGGINKSYPFVLEELLNKNNYRIPVYNNGVSDEDSLTVLGRQGAIPYCVDSFNLKNSPDLIEVKVTSSYNGAEVNPLLGKRNPGVNPCTIDGIEGTLYGYVLPANRSKVDKFYFMRDDTGNTADIAKNTHIITSGNDYKDYINILAIGENGGYADNKELIDQHKKFVEFLKGSKNENSYLILGMTKGNREDNKEIDEMMAEEFGEHYVNVREYLSTNALDDLNLTASDEDKKAMAEGKVPPCLWYDEDNLNDNAYEAIGNLVYNKLVEYNYVKK